MYATAQEPEPAVETPPDAAEAPTQSFEDETNSITHEDLRCGDQLHGDDDDDDGGDGGVDDYVLPSGESREVGHEQPTYGDLYDEQLMENNMRCYMQ